MLHRAVRRLEGCLRVHVKRNFPALRREIDLFVSHTAGAWPFCSSPGHVMVVIISK
jgi:hypothetical protein